MRRLPVLLFAFIPLAACSSRAPDPSKGGLDLGPIQSFEGERMPVHTGMGTIEDRRANDNHALALYSNSSSSIMIELFKEVAGFEVRARGDQCQGGPHLQFKVDGVLRIDTEVGSTWTQYPALLHLTAGPHTFEVAFDNDRNDGSECDRNLYVDRVTFLSVRPVLEGTLLGTAMLSGTGTEVADDRVASEGRVLEFYNRSSAAGILRTSQAAGLSVRARATLCRGAPQFLLGVDGVTRGWFEVPSMSWADYQAPVSLAAGEHVVTIDFANDFAVGDCARNLFVASVTSLPTAPPPVPLSLPDGPSQTTPEGSPSGRPPRPAHGG